MRTSKGQHKALVAAVSEPTAAPTKGSHDKALGNTVKINQTAGARPHTKSMHQAPSLATAGLSLLSPLRVCIGKKKKSPSVFLSDLLPSILLFCYFPILPFLLTTCSMPLHFIIPPHLISSCSSSSSLPLSILAHFIFTQGGSWCTQADEGCSHHCPNHI